MEKSLNYSISMKTPKEPNYLSLKIGGFEGQTKREQRDGPQRNSLSITTLTQQALSISVPFDVGLVNDREHKPPKESIYGRLTREFFEYLVELYYK